MSVKAAAGATLWHNPRCSTSRATLALLQARGVEVQIRLYLEAPPDRAELAAVLARLDLPAARLLRWKSDGLPEGLTPASSEDDILAALAADPRLIERPVVIHAGRARLGRPPEAVLDLF